MATKKELLRRWAGQGEGGDTLLVHATKGDLVIPKEIRGPQIDKAFQAMMVAKGHDPDRFTVGAKSNKRNKNTGLYGYDAEGGSGGDSGGGDAGGAGTGGGNAGDSAGAAGGGDTGGASQGGGADAGAGAAGLGDTSGAGPGAPGSDVTGSQSTAASEVGQAPGMTASADTGPAVGDLSSGITISDPTQTTQGPMAALGQGLLSSIGFNTQAEPADLSSIQGALFGPVAEPGLNTNAISTALGMVPGPIGTGLGLLSQAAMDTQVGQQFGHSIGLNSPGPGVLGQIGNLSGFGLSGPGSGPSPGEGTGGVGEGSGLGSSLGVGLGPEGNTSIGNSPSSPPLTGGDTFANILQRAYSSLKSGSYSPLMANVMANRNAG